jgi:hypothetical protein
MVALLQHLAGKRRTFTSSPFPPLAIGETGVKWDTGSKGTVGGKIVDVNKTLKIFSMLCKSV